MREMKDSGIPWLGLIPSDWNVLKVKNIAKRKSDKNMPDEQVLSLYRELGIVIKADREDNHNVTSENTENYKFVEIDDLVVNKMKAWQGSIAISAYQGIVSPAYYVYRITDKNCYPWFIHYILRCTAYLPEYRRLSGGIRLGQWDLSDENFKNIPLPIPGSYAEQKLIADYLESKCSKIDEIISKQEQIIEKLKEYKLSVITEAVTKGLNPDVEMKDSEVEWIGDIPQRWETMSLGMVSSDIRNGYVGPTREILVDSGIPYIQSLHVKDGKISFEKAEYFVSKEWGDKHPKVKEGQLVIVQTGDIGQVGLVEKHMDGFNCHALIILTLDRKKIHPNYLQYYLRSKPGKELMLQTSTGALLPHLNSGKVKSTTVLCPPVTEQMMIAEYLDAKCSSIDKTIDLESSLVQKACEYKKSLIYEVVTGKKEV